MEWNIRSRSTHCQVTGKAFEPDEVFYTMLLDTPQGIERQDLSAEAWEKRDPSIQPLSYWKSVFKPTPPPQPEAVNKNDAESELRQLLKSDNPSDTKVCFLLACMLERKRILKFKERVKIGTHSGSIYEHQQTQETFFIVEPEIHLDEIENLQIEIKTSSSKIFASSELLYHSPVTPAT